MAATAVVLALPGGAGAVSSVPQTGSGTIVVDGAVNAIATVGSTMILGGAFTHAGPYTGGFASVPVGGGTPTTLPQVGGTVYAVVSDGSGGWYVGGSFSSVGTSSISNLVHITSGGVVDTSWVPAPNGQVNALALSGGTLYVGGKFSTIGGTSRNELAALAAGTGAATSWNPNPDGTVVSAIALSPSGATVYVAGDFSNVGTTARAGLAAIDSSSGAATSWNPNPSATNTVNALAVSPDGNTVYAGGTFTSIGGNSLSELAAISSSTGSSNASWAPAPHSSGSSAVNALALSSDGGTLYVGGTFTLIGSTAQTRNYLAAVSTSSPGNPTSWDPSTTGSSVTALGLSSDGGTLYVGGTFTQIGGQSRQNLAAVTTSSSATATSWQEDTNAAPNAITATSSAVGVGGAISSVDLQSRNELAAISTSGTLLDFNPGVSGGAVNALAVSPDSSTLYVGGAFTGATATVGGQVRRGLAAVSISTGVTTSWNPSPAVVVNSLAAATIGSDVFVYAALGSGTQRLVAYSGSSGSAASGFSPATTGNAINTLALSPDGKVLFVGGSFTSGVGTRIGAVSSTDGTAASGWTMPSLTNGAVTSIAVSSDGTTLYLGGTFSNVGAHLIGANTAGTVTFTGSILPTTTAVGVDAIAVSGSTIYAGGTFTSSVGANTVTRTRLAAFDSTSANASSWDPAPNSGTVSALAVTSSGVYVGGSWTSTIGSTSLPYYAVFALSSPAVSTAPAVSGTLTPGSTLSCSTGTWTNSPTSYAYQWLRGGSAISGATSSTYVAGTADVGKQISCQVTATNGEGSASSTSASVTIVSVPGNSAAPTVTGSALVGATLSCDPGTWTQSPTFAYAWLRDGTAISGATATTYTVTSADAGHPLSCRVTGTNAAGSAQATSASVTIGSAPVNSALPTISGSASVGGTLSCDPGTWTQSPTFAYAWLRDGTAISGATTTTYAPTSADAGHALSCRVTGTNAAGSADATSASVTVPPPAVQLTAAPTLSGTATLGSTLSCSTGTWANSPTSYAYQWLRDGAAISGATGTTYVPGNADVGHELSCQVTASSSGGSASSTSASETIVGSPQNTAAPTVQGALAVGTPLTCDPGTWTQAPSFVYVWLRDGTAIPGAATTTYTPTSADVEHALSCRVTGTNAAGSAIATSAAVIVPTSAPPVTPPTTGAGVSSIVVPSNGGTLSLSQFTTVTWAAGAFASAGTVAVSPVKLTANLNGFSKASPIVSVAYTPPGASASTPVFLQSPITVVFPKSVVPAHPYVATSEDGVTYTPIPLLAKDELPDGQLDGYFVRANGSLVIYTRHVSTFGLLRDIEAPTSPATLVGSLKGTVLRLSWAPAADNSRVIALYEVVRGKKIVAKVLGSHTISGFSVALLTRTSVYKVVAVDAAGNVSKLSPGITVTVAPRPKGVPTRIPTWAQKLRLWLRTPKALRGPRPAAPTTLPSWFRLWNTWVSTRLSIRP